MPIGVPRIIYCWGEELPPQWTDIYNFIFRRRMVFLMQYLDDELCNQICGLLINIHMEDRSKELEKKEIEKSGIFKSTNKSSKDSSPNSSVGGTSERSALFDTKNNLNDGKKLKKDKSMEDLLSSYGNSLYEEDLAIDENYTLEQYTLQKITLEWLNWNAQFFDYSDEPYLFYLAEILSKDFTKDDTGQLFYNFNYAKTNPNNQFGSTLENLVSSNLIKPTFDTKKCSGIKKNAFQEYWPFRSILNLANLISKDQNFKIKNLLPKFIGNAYQLSNNKAIRGTLASSPYLDSFHPNTVVAKENVGEVATTDTKETQSTVQGMQLCCKKSFTTPLPKNNGQNLLNQFNQLNQKPGLTKLLGVLASKEFVKKNTNSQKQQSVATKVLGQRNLRKEYALDNNFNNYGSFGGQSPLISEYGSFRSAAFKTGHRERKEEQNVLDSSQKLQKNKRALNYLEFDSASAKQINKKGNKKSFSAATRKQTKRALQEEESKKVFVIINSFGGSVGNGITVHDALQFIKAGSLTLGLGVAASAASLVLAGGTISERYVTEGCHVMIHQPEGGLNGQASDIWIDSQEIMKIRLDVAEIYSLSAHRPRHKILRDLDRDFYLTATETIHYGLADEIATNDVMHQIIEMTSKVWDYHDSKQQRLLETRNSANAVDTQTQS